MEPRPSDANPGGNEVLDERLHAVLSAAGEVGTGVPVDRLTELLLADSPSSATELTSYLARRPPLGHVDRGVAFDPTLDVVRDATSTRQARARTYLDAAGRFASVELALVAPLICCISVTGSTAYGEPEEGDDCDLFAVVRPGALWVVLLFLYLRHRIGLRGGRSDGDPPVWCANHVFEAEAAREVFGRPQGFLFAREALTARPVAGESYYRGLLASAAWMGDEAPRLYARWASEGWGESTKVRPAPCPVRLVNSLLYPLVSAYLQLAAVLRNHRFQRSGRIDETFRVVTRPDRLTLLTRRFARLNASYARGSVTRRVPPEG
ncbi:MAG: hypothetical protein ACREDK_01985 [Thermoplasmata archaeon]